jgi:hypothetical protein
LPDKNIRTLGRYKKFKASYNMLKDFIKINAIEIKSNQDFLKNKEFHH